MNRIQAVCAANIGLAVAIGAFGAHALRGRIADDMLEVFKTGQAYHLAIAIAALVLTGFARKALLRATVALLIGTVLFSGSLYTLALSGHRIWGAVTPIGGVVWIVTWLAVAAHVWNNPVTFGTETADKG